jgi:hypothetical protein
MDRDQAPTAAYYRKTAGQIRDLASKAHLPEVRRELFELAERFDDGQLCREALPQYTRPPIVTRPG